jgi:ribosomal protein L7/L12
MTSDPFNIPQALQDSVFAMAASGESIEAMAQKMADAHLEKIVAIKLLRQATHSTLYEAKANIHFSAAYSYRREADDAFHDSLFKALEEEGFIESETEAVAASPVV